MVDMIALLMLSAMTPTTGYGIFIENMLKAAG
jgi:hypothetical protein